MDTRDRRIVGSIWIAVAALMAISLGLDVPTSLEGYLQLFVVVLSLFLAVVYLFDPWGILARHPLHE